MSDVPEGYRMSEVGVIPDEWKVKTLGDCLLRNPEYGINAPAVPYSDNLPTYIRITDISEEGRFLPEKKSSVNNINSNNYFLEKDDIVFARTGASTGKTYLYNSNDGDLVFAGFLIRVKVNPNELIAQYLKSYTETGAYWNWVKIMSMRSGQPGINGNEYAQLRIPLPPLPEQHAIASALSDMDALITALEQLITKKHNIKQGAMQQLLTGKKRLPRFGGVWEVKKLGEIVREFLNGGTPSTRFENYWNGNIPWITGADILNQKVSVIRRYITNDAVKNSSTNIIEQGHLLLVSRTGVGKLAIAPFDVAISQDFTGIYVKNEELLAEYLYRYFDFNQSTLQSQNQGTSIQGITRDTLSAIPIPLPPLPEQHAIAQILSDMDAEIDAIELKQTKYRAIKQGMMQELLTGKTRLV